VMSMSVYLSVCPLGYLKNHIPSSAICYVLIVFVDDIMFLYDGPSGSVTLLQQLCCYVVHGLTLLLYAIGCILSQTTAGAKTRHVLHARGPMQHCCLVIMQKLEH